MKINQILPQETNFTEVLNSIALKPKMLYFYGKMPENVVLEEFDVARGRFVERPGRPRSVAIVGARRNTSYGEKVAYEAAYAAAKAGAVVISGLAYGIDSIAHRGAVDAGGKTVAVLGTPIDQIYPRRHKGLAEEIIARGGAVMSELAPGVKYFAKTSFLERNRLISGLADVVLVVEAAERSGTLNTAMHALDQGRELMAVPGNVGNVMSVGCNRLLQQGAGVYTGPDDLLRLLFPARERKLRQKKLPVGDTEVETVILQLIYRGVADGDEILEQAGLDAAEFSRALTMLEIKGRVRALGMNKWMLV